MINIKIVTAHKELEGKTLTLVLIDEMIYKCQTTGIEIIDTCDELSVLKDWSIKYNSKIFYDMHLFCYGENELQFIDEIELIQ